MFDLCTQVEPMDYEPRIDQAMGIAIRSHAARCAGKGSISSARKGGKRAVLKLCKSPVAGALVLLAVSLVGVRGDTSFGPLVAGVSSIACPGAVGPVFGTAPDWVAIVGGDDDTSQPSTLVMARTYGSGRVVVMGHDALLTDAALLLLDNALFMGNVIRWLDAADLRQVQHTTSHGEFVHGGPLQSVLGSKGYAFAGMTAPVTASKLANASVLIIGNAWQEFTADEIEAVRQFVAGGGGLLMAGLGWSWEPYHAGKTIEDYPMTRIAAPYEARWHRAVISDPTHQFNNSPVFHTFYPNIVNCTPTSAMSAITDAHATYGTTLPVALESNAALRTSLAAAHACLAIPASELPVGHKQRQDVFNYYLELMYQWPNAYARVSPINQALYPKSAWLRERAWRTLRDCMELTPERKTTMAGAARLSGQARDIFMDFDLILLDNCRLDANQLASIHNLMSLIPSGLHNLRSISVRDFLGTAPSNVSLDGQPGAVNIFGVPVESGGPVENSFPSDVPAGWIKLFCAALAHEVNHVVDSFSISENADRTLATRRADLISQAGKAHLEYLRSMLPDDFFVSAPQEFMASIANQWFTDSAKTVTLGIDRFGHGHMQPINQALFFAELYSRGGSTTCFFTVDAAGIWTRTSVPLRRDAAGRIVDLQVGNTLQSYTLDTAGNVTATQLFNTHAPVLNITVSGQMLELSWPELPLGYTVESSSTMAEGTWQPVTDTTIQSDGRLRLTLPITGGRRFFRLRSP